MYNKKKYKDSIMFKQDEDDYSFFNKMYENTYKKDNSNNDYNAEDFDLLKKQDSLQVKPEDYGDAFSDMFKRAEADLGISKARYAELPINTGSAKKMEEIRQGKFIRPNVKEEAGINNKEDLIKSPLSEDRKEFLRSKTEEIYKLPKRQQQKALKQLLKDNPDLHNAYTDTVNADSKNAFIGELDKLKGHSYLSDSLGAMASAVNDGAYAVNRNVENFIDKNDDKGLFRNIAAEVAKGGVNVTNTLDKLYTKALYGASGRDMSENEKADMNKGWFEKTKETHDKIKAQTDEFSTISEDDNFAEKVVKSTVSSVTQMLVGAAMGNTIGSMGLSSAGAGISEAEERGSDNSVLYGNIQGIIEAGSEKFFGSTIMNKMLNGAGFKGVKEAIEAVGEQGLKGIAMEALKEGGQEYLTEIANNLAALPFKDGNGNTLAPDDWYNLLSEDKLVAFASGGLMGGVGGTVANVSNTKTSSNTENKQPELKGFLKDELSPNKTVSNTVSGNNFIIPKEAQAINEALGFEAITEDNVNSIMENIDAPYIEKSINEVGQEVYITEEGNTVNAKLVEMVAEQTGQPVDTLTKLNQEASIQIREEAEVRAIETQTDNTIEAIDNSIKEEGIKETVKTLDKALKNGDITQEVHNNAIEYANAVSEQEITQDNSNQQDLSQDNTNKQEVTQDNSKTPAMQQYDNDVKNITETMENDKQEYIKETSKEEIKNAQKNSKKPLTKKQIASIKEDVKNRAEAIFDMREFNAIESLYNPYTEKQTDIETYGTIEEQQANHDEALSKEEKKSYEAKVKKLDKVVKSKGFKAIFEGTDLKVVENLTAKQDSVNELAKAIGREVVFYKANKKNAPNGFMADNTLFINGDFSGSAMAQVLGHETFHTLKNSHPETFNELIKYGRENFTAKEITDFLAGIDNKAEVSKLKNNPDLLVEEMLSEAFGNDFANKDFWKGLEKNNKTLFEKIKDVIATIFNRAKSYKTDFLTEKHIEELRTEFEGIFGDLTGNATYESKINQMEDPLSVEIPEKASSKEEVKKDNSTRDERAKVFINDVKSENVEFIGARETINGDLLLKYNDKNTKKDFYVNVSPDGMLKSNHPEFVDVYNSKDSKDYNIIASKKEAPKKASSKAEEKLSNMVSNGFALTEKYTDNDGNIFVVGKTKATKNTTMRFKIFSDGDVLTNMSAPDNLKIKGNEVSEKASSNNDDVKFATRKGKEFDKWFEGSVMVKDNGEPEVYYHATNARFDDFDDNAKAQTRRAFGAGHYFSTGKAWKLFGKNAYSVNLNLKNPLSTNDVIGKRKAMAIAKRIYERYDIYNLGRLREYYEKNNNKPIPVLQFLSAMNLQETDFREVFVEFGYDGIVKHDGKMSQIIAFSNDSVNIVERVDEEGVRFSTRQPDPRPVNEIPDVVRNGIDYYTTQIAGIGGKIRAVSYDDEGNMVFSYKLGDGFKTLTYERGAMLPFYGVNRDEIKRYPYSIEAKNRAEIDQTHDLIMDKFNTGEQTFYDDYFEDIKEWSRDEEIENKEAMPILKPLKAGQVGSKSFNKWFGNSQVVDENGDPKVVYHGSMFKDITKFDSDRAMRQLYGEGFYFTEDAGLASEYAKNKLWNTAGEVYKTYLKIENPFTINSEDVESGLNSIGLDESEYTKEKMKELGYDGIYVEDLDYWVAFDSNQIKSATDNNGNFDVNNDDIRFSTRSKEETAKITAPLNNIADKVNDMQLRLGIKKLQGIKIDKDIDLKAIFKEAINVMAESEEGYKANVKAFSEALVNEYGIDKKQARGISKYFANVVETSIKNVESNRIKSKAVITTSAYKGKSKSIMAQVGDKFDKFYSRIVDITHFGKLVNDNFKTKARLSKNSFSIVDNIALESLTDKDGNVVGKSIKELFEDVIPIGREVDFMTYTLHKHNISRDMQGKPVFGDISGVESQKIVNSYESKNPDFKAKSEELTGWINTFMKTWAVDTGLITEDFHNALMELYPDYIPTNRNFEDHEELFNGGYSGRGFVDKSKPIKRATGSNRDIIDIQESIVQLVSKTVRTAKMNEVGQELVKAIQTNKNLVGIAEIVEEASNTDNNVRVLVNGEAVYVEVHNKDLLELLKQVHSPEYDAVTEVAKSFNGCVKSLITTKNPLFAITNTLRDYQTYMVNSTENNVLKRWGNIGKAFKMVIEDTVSKEQKQNELQLFKAMGIGGSGIMAKDNTKTLSNITGRKAIIDKQTGAIIGYKDFNGLQKSLIKMSDFLEVVTGTTETTFRLAEFIGALERGDTVDGATLKAMEVTTDFSRGGDITKQTDAYVKYLNAGVQGVDRFTRQVKKHPVQTITRSIVHIVAPALLLAAINGDDDEYEALDDRTKDNNFLIPMRLFGGDETQFIKVPKAREYGMVAMFAERIIYGRGFDNLGRSIKENIMPPSAISDNIIFDLARLGDNEAKDFAGRYIVPKELQDEAPKNQFDENTTVVAKWLGQLTGLSPKKIDYYLDSYSGVIGDIMQPLLTPSTYSSKGDTTSRILSPVKKKFVADNAYSNQYPAKYYENLDNITSIIEEEQKGMSTQEKRAFTSETEKFKKYINDTYNKDISEINTLLKDSTLSDKDKKDLRRFKNTAMKMANNDINLFLKPTKRQ